MRDMWHKLLCVMGKHSAHFLYWAPVMGGKEEQRCYKCGRKISTREITLSEVRSKPRYWV